MDGMLGHSHFIERVRKELIRRSSLRRGMRILGMLELLLLQLSQFLYVGLQYFVGVVEHFRIGTPIAARRPKIRVVVMVSNEIRRENDVERKGSPHHPNENVV